MIHMFDYFRSLIGIEGEIMAAIEGVLRSRNLFRGEQTEAFEHEFAAFVGAKNCVGVASGTAALHLSLLALNLKPGDEVITVSNTCVPTIAAIRLAGALPVLVDIGSDDLMMDPSLVAQSITERTRCILPVHMWGNGAKVEKLVRIADDHGIQLIEDCAHAIGTMIRGRHAGTFGVMGCFSFYPTKNLGAYGDAGAIVTNDDDLAARLRRLQIYGYDDNACAVDEGLNARIDEIQAAILRTKLRYLPEWLARRRDHAATYDRELTRSEVAWPARRPEVQSSFHQYVVRTPAREALRAWLWDRGIETAIHYPIPVHQMPAYRFLTANGFALKKTERAAVEILSLPIHEGLTAGEIEMVVHAVNDPTWQHQALDKVDDKQV